VQEHLHALITAWLTSNTSASDDAAAADFVVGAQALLMLMLMLMNMFARFAVSAASSAPV
jgi:hypothetical protein